MKILVTGGAGFIGSHIADRLIKEGHQVVIVDNLSTGKEENINPKAAFYNLDIRSKELEYVFKKEKPDCVDHHAAQMSVAVSMKKPVFDADVNILGVLNILQNCVKYNVKKLVFASSGGTVYGEAKNVPTTENEPFCPLSPYGISKLTTEYYLSFYNHEYNLPYVALRYGNVYGPRQDPHGEAGVVAIFIKAMLTGKTPTIFGKGDCVRDYVYVDDIVAANMLALNQNICGSFNIGTAKGTDVKEVFNALKHIIDFPKNCEYGPAREGDLKRSILSFDKAQKTLSWKPCVSLYKGFEGTVDFFRRNG
ncbi:NAD-dependent epimerase/dehydratase family protein [bacterium]|nr:NAD-dependent epimerase/dehydratase family protein [bacterium]